MTMLLTPKPQARRRRGRSVFDCEPGYRLVKAVRIAVRIQALHHPALACFLRGPNARRTATSWSRR